MHHRCWSIPLLALSSWPDSPDARAATSPSFLISRHSFHASSYAFRGIELARRTSYKAFNHHSDLVAADMRKFHKKSKLGCKQCKARRVKCDETRPVCRKCSHASLECSFILEKATKCPADDVSTAPTSRANVDAVQATTAKGQHTILSSLPVTTTLATALPPPPYTSLDERFSALHLRLLRHFEHDFYQHQRKVHPGLDELLALFVETAWTTPYLLDELLAYAAAHKSTVDRVSNGFYLYEAKRLQTRALTLYNSERPILCDETCLPMFLFSGLLSHHTMFEVRIEGLHDLRLAVDALTQSIEIHRGLHAIARSAWPMFSEQDQQRFTRSCQREIPDVSGGPRSRDECNTLLDHLDQAHLEPVCKSMCRSAVEDLQERFDSLSLSDTHTTWAAIQDWLVAVPVGYVELLKHMQPEALVVLAHFAVLLHYGAEHWFIADLGARLVQLVNGHLGPHWETWLEWPIRATANDPNRYRTKY